MISDKYKECVQWGEGRSIQLRANWDEMKLDIMREILYDKFTRNLDLKAKLISTGAKYLEETCNWHDNFWGLCICKKCNGKGKNNLGKILMEIRDNLNEN